MVFPHSSIPINPIVFDAFGLGNMVHRNAWNQTASVLREINRITNQIQENLNQPKSNCSNAGETNCASSSAYPGFASARASSSSSVSVPSLNGDTFEVKVDVEHFKPEEITVKLVDGNNLIVEGKHEERSDGQGTISRSFIRRMIIPDNYDSLKLESQLSLNGVLTIKAPRKPIQGSNGEKIIPITLTSNISTVDCNETINKSSPSSEKVPIGKQQSTSKDDNNQVTINSDGLNQPEASKND